MTLQLWETLKESITAYTGVSPATFFTVVVVGFSLYYVVSNLFGSSDDGHVQRRSRSLIEKQMEPLPPPVQLGEVSSEELKMYDGSDPKKPLLMAIKGQIYDVSQGRMFYGPGGAFGLFAGKDASRAIAKQSSKEENLNGDLHGLSVFQLKHLQAWEDKFMEKFVKVGTVKTTVPVTDDGPSKGQAEEASQASQSNAAKPADAEVAKPAEGGPSQTAAPKETEENDVEKKE